MSEEISREDLDRIEQKLNVMGVVLELILKQVRPPDPTALAMFEEKMAKRRKRDAKKEQREREMAMAACQQADKCPYLKR